MSDALERLKKQNRPVVQSRDASLNSTSPDTSISSNLNNQISANPDIEVSNSAGVQIPENETTQKAQRATRRELETKQSTLRLEAKLSKRVQTLCQKQGICREVLIEAMFEYCEENSEAMIAILTKAKEKNEFRQQIANRRRAKSMIDRFGG